MKEYLETEVLVIGNGIAGSSAALRPDRLAPQAPRPRIAAPLAWPAISAGTWRACRHAGGAGPVDHAEPSLCAAVRGGPSTRARGSSGRTASAWNACAGTACAGRWRSRAWKSTPPGALRTTCAIR